MIEIRLLSYFLAIAREQSITKAADALHITQPTLSKQMMELEAQLGKQLLIRGKKKITLTEEGAYLRSKAQEMINLMEKTESAFHTDEELISVIDGYMDFEQFGEDSMKEDGVRQTEFGLVRRLSSPFDGQTPLQQVF